MGVEALSASTTTLASAAATPQPFFHPDFVDHWRVVAEDPVYPQPTAVESATTKTDTSYKIADQLLPDQVVQAVEWNEMWIRITDTGLFVPRHAVVPFWPVYRIIDKTQAQAGGVAPYVVVPPSPSNVKDEMAIVLPETLQTEPYEHESSLRNEDMTLPVGHVFDQPPLLLAEQEATETAATEEEDPSSSSSPQKTNKTAWWTANGLTWWPVMVPSKKLFCLNGNKRVMELVCPMTPSYIQEALDKRGAAPWILAIILLEYMFMIVGAALGVHLGWTLYLQLAYGVCMLALVMGELRLVKRSVPNGALWIRMNRHQIPRAFLRGIFWRLDLYGDVGFCVLLYQRRNEVFTSGFWVVPIVLVSIVTLGRLSASMFYFRDIQLDGKLLSKLTVPSFLNVFRVLCQSFELADADLAFSNARTDLTFEALRSCMEDFPEIIFQSVYLMEVNTAVGCTDCSSGFVLFSLILSIVTAVPGTVRLLRAISRYTAYKTTNDVAQTKTDSDCTERIDSDALPCK